MKVICDSQRVVFVSKVTKKECFEFTREIDKAMTFDDEQTDLAWYLAYKAGWLDYGHFYVASR